MLYSKTLLLYSSRFSGLAAALLARMEHSLPLVIKSKRLRQLAHGPGTKLVRSFSRKASRETTN